MKQILILVLVVFNIAVYANSPVVYHIKDPHIDNIIIIWSEDFGFMVRKIGRVDSDQFASNKDVLKDIDHEFFNKFIVNRVKTSWMELVYSIKPRKK